jgi:hypothetical protein
MGYEIGRAFELRDWVLQGVGYGWLWGGEEMKEREQRRAGQQDAGH